MSSNLTPFNSDGGFNTTGNITGGNIVTSGSGGDITLTGGNITGANVVSANTVSATVAANVNSINISQSIRWDYSGSEIYEDGGLVINGPGGVLAQGNVSAQFEFNDGAGNSSGLYSTIEESVIYSVEYVTVRANNSGTQTDWTFGTDGNLTFPSGNLVITPDYAAFSNAAVVSSVNNLISLSTGVTGGTSSLWVEDYANIGTSNIAAVYANPVPGSGNVRIAVGTNGGSGPNLWDFGYNGASQSPVVEYANLTAVAGGRAFVNDANLVAAGNFGAQITGGAGNTVPVWSDGANWYIG